MTALDIGGRRVGPGAPCYVVAEISANHNQQLDRAIEIIRAARRAGADAVKLQTYTPDTLTIDSDREWFQIRGKSLWSGKTLYQLYGEAFTPWPWHAELFRVAREEGLGCFSTPFDATAVALLEELGAPVHKIASFEIVDIPLLRAIAATGKPVIMSTGMASVAEIEEAVEALRSGGAGPLALLKCTSAYPAPPEAMNLRTIPDLRERFATVVGLSDHTMGSKVACAAVALGAAIVEKHFTLRRADGGPDSAFSMEPAEFAQMVADIRETEQALGGVSYERSSDEEANVAFRRSLFVVADVAAGERFSARSVRSIRPGHGLHPRHLDHVMARTATRDIPRGTPLAWDMVDGGAAGVSPAAALTPRLATAADAELVWQWRNDPETRLRSLHVEEIPWPSHQTWFTSRLDDPDTVFYVLERAGAGPVAHVRFERRDAEAEVHITVAPSHRGRGVGTSALHATLPLALHALQVRRLTATVKPDNQASLRAFERNGFEPQAAAGTDGTLRLRYDAR